MKTAFVCAGFSLGFQLMGTSFILWGLVNPGKAVNLANPPSLSPSPCLAPPGLSPPHKFSLIFILGIFKPTGSGSRCPRFRSFLQNSLVCVLSLSQCIWKDHWTSFPNEWISAQAPQKVDRQTSPPSQAKVCPWARAEEGGAERARGVGFFLS